LVVHVHGGDGALAPSTFWEFASEDALCAFVLAGNVLSLQPGYSERVRIPDDVARLRRVVLGAVLGLTQHDLAFQDVLDRDDGDVGIAERSEFVVLRHAALAASAADCGFLNCLLAYPWVTDQGIAEELPAFAGFLADLSTAAGLLGLNSVLVASPDLAESAGAWVQQVHGAAPVFWDIFAFLAQPSRSLLRSCARLSYVSPPSLDQAGVMLQRCLAEARVASDCCNLASLVVFAANAGCAPCGDALAETLASVPLDLQARVAGRLQTWTGPVQVEAVASWTALLAAAPNGELAPISAAPAVPTTGLASPPGLRDLLHDVPVAYRCAIDGRLLVDPVWSPAGYSFERSNLRRALERTGGLCPITKAHLKLDECHRDAELRARILRWVRESRPRQKAD